jgi:ketosteroid isomerase-like protein
MAFPSAWALLEAYASPGGYLRAMSRENLEVAEQAIAAVNERDVDGYLALCTSDVEMVSPVASLEGTDRGAAGIRHFFSMLDEATDNFRLELERVEAVGGDRAFAFTRVSRASEGGIPVAALSASVYDLAEGKIRRVQVFLDRQEALEAVGLSE